MAQKEYKLVLFTHQGSFELNVVSEQENFDAVIAEALDQAGTVLLNLADGGSLVLTAINTVAIAVYECDEDSVADGENSENPPRVTKL